MRCINHASVYRLITEIGSLFSILDFLFPKEAYKACASYTTFCWNEPEQAFICRGRILITSLQASRAC